MSIIIDKIIDCSLYGKLSVKDNCLFCFLPEKIKFVRTIDNYDMLKEFKCNNCLDLIDVEKIV